jgi:hypothetical protein
MQRFLVLILLKINKKFLHCSQNINARFALIGIHLGIFTFLLCNIWRILRRIFRRRGILRRLWRRKILWRMLLKRLCRRRILRRGILWRMRIWRRRMLSRMMLNRLCRRRRILRWRGIFEKKNDVVEKNDILEC